MLSYMSLVFFGMSSLYVHLLLSIGIISVIVLLYPSKCRALLKSYSECESSADMIIVQNAWLSQQNPRVAKGLQDVGMF